MLEKIDKALEIMSGKAPEVVLEQFSSFRKVVRYSSGRVSDYDIVMVLQPYVSNNEWARRAIEVFMGPSPKYDPSRDR